MLIRNEGWTVAKVSDRPLPLAGVFIHDARRNHCDIMTVVHESIGKCSSVMVKEGTFEMIYGDSKVYLSVTEWEVTIGFKLKEGVDDNES